MRPFHAMMREIHALWQCVRVGSAIVFHPFKRIPSIIDASTFRARALLDCSSLIMKTACGPCDPAATNLNAHKPVFHPSRWVGLALSAHIFALAALAQSPLPDSFNPGANYYVYSLAVQADG